jgi:hypothetical protein
MQLIGCLGAGLDRRALGHAQHADRFHTAVGGLGGTKGFTGLDCPGGSDRVDGVGLAMATPGAPVGPVDLDHDEALLAQPAGQPCTPTAGALDPDAVNDPELRCPLDEFVESAGGGRDSDCAEMAAELVERCGDVGVGVGIDSERDERLGFWHGGHGRLLSCVWLVDGATDR